MSLLFFLGGAALPAFVMKASANVAPGGEDTTAQLTPPSGKTTADFGGGRLQDDGNTTTSIDLAANKYREDEWCVEATESAEAGVAYEFRVVVSPDTALDSYPAYPTLTVGTALTVTLGLVTETDAAATSGRIKAKAFGQAAAADTSQPFSRRKTATLGQPSEGDVSQAFGRLKARALGQNSEADTSQTFKWAPKTRLLGLNAEADLAQAFGRLKARTFGQGAETDLAQTVRRSPLARLVGQVAEAGAAQTWTRLKARALGLNTETDLAETTTVSHRITVAVGLISEADTATAWTHAKLRAIGLNTEALTSQGLTRIKTRAIALVTEASLSQPFAHSRSRTIGQGTETDAATLSLRRKARTLGLNTETDLSQSCDPVLSGGGHTVVIGLSAETDLAQAWSSARRKSLNITLETDAAQAFSRRKSRTLSLTAEASVSTPFARSKSRTLGQALGAETCQPFGRIKVRGFQSCSETDLGLGMSAVRARIIPFLPAAELGGAFGVGRLKSLVLGVTGELDEAYPVVWTGFVIVLSGRQAVVGVASVRGVDCRVRSVAAAEVVVGSTVGVELEVGIMATENNLSCYRGERFTITFTDTDGTARTEQEVVYRLRRGGYDGAVVVEKSKSDNNVTFPSGTWPSGSAMRVVLTPDDTTLTPGTYYYTLSADDEELLGYGAHSIKRPRAAV